jgi:class 3 adenylate cyclase
MADDSQNNLLNLFRLGARKTLSGEDSYPTLRDLGSLGRGLTPIDIPTAVPPLLRRVIAPPPPSAPPAHSINWFKNVMTLHLKNKVELKAGRVLPNIDDLAIMEGRHINAAFVYSDLHGFTKLVATQPTGKSFVLLNAFVAVTNYITKHYNGQVMDCAGDRLLSVFHRVSTDNSNEPVEDAITAAFWLQTIFNKVISPRFGEAGMPNLSLGIGVDYSSAVVGCVGIRNNKRLVFFGDAANHAAKLQEMAGTGETILSTRAFGRQPSYLRSESWKPKYEKMPNGEIIVRHNQMFAANDDQPPVKVR